MKKPSQKPNDALVTCPICQSNMEQLAAAIPQNQSNPWVIVRIIQKRYVVGRFPNQPEAQTQLRFLTRTIPDAKFELADERVIN